MADAEGAAQRVETITLTGQCYCKSTHFTLTVPEFALPLRTHMCHCSVCRYTHGTLCIFHAPLPPSVVPQFVAPSTLEGSCTPYLWSPTEAKSTRYFCSTCGCHIGDVGVEGGEGAGEWTLSTSVIRPLTEEEGKGKWVGMKWQELRSHVFTEQAPGGGAYDWLPRLGAGRANATTEGEGTVVEGRELKKWNPEASDPFWAECNLSPTVSSPEPAGSDGIERLRAQCHCGGVSFTIPRPTPEVLDSTYLRQWVSPVTPTKWVACADLCDDCRLVSGAHFVGWTFIPRRLIGPTTGLDLLIGTSKTFASSEGVLRSFCGVCGATVFFSCDERRPSDDDQMLDLAVGILRAPEGPLATNWLTWRTGRVAWLDSGKKFEPEFATGLFEGMKSWGEKEDGEVLGFDIP